MAYNLSTAEKFFPALAASGAMNLVNSSALTYAQGGKVRVVYAPFDHVASHAKLVVVGITPGAAQASAALAEARKHLAAGLPITEVLRRAKLIASFSGGAMRNNLVSMLDAIGVADLFSLSSTDALFTPGAEHVHFTSALRYPVFIDGQNYNGNPDMIRTPILREIVEKHLAEEAALLPNAVWLPLGPKPQAALLHLAGAGLLDRSRILAGLPHPSGANAERVAVFLGQKDPRLASAKTNPAPLLAACAALRRQIAELNGGRN
ncbi:MAG: hypothetical protein ACO1O4_14440 [Devosia sp.]